MPYLTEQRKKEIDSNPNSVLAGAGDLTYKLTRIALDCSDGGFADNIYDAIKRYMPRQPRYENYAIVLGCLDSTRRELHRREPYSKNLAGKSKRLMLFSDSYYNNVIAPYENEKIEQNGDVF